MDRRYDARAISNLILDQADAMGKSISNMALNKLIYYAHAWFLVSFQRPLIIQHFEAWQHGPLVQDVYHAFKQFKDSPITGRATRLDRETAKRVDCSVNLPPNELALLVRVVDDYGSIPASKLRAMSHVQGGPWDQTWNYIGHSNPGMVIPDELIASYYSRLFLPVGDVDAYSESSQRSAFRAFRQ